tara:strand:- start:640 stop:1446 length:807 start_codon:yes stop_codon:yes gene_type:complete
MPFAIIGFFLASQKYSYDWGNLLYIILCMIFARSAAMAFNRYIDRDIDAINKRTANTREIPKGNIKPKNAMYFVIVNCLLFTATTYLLNNLCFYLSPIALLIILGYSYTKRFTSLCHVILGLGLSLSPIGAYLAVSNSFDLLPILFSLVVICWVSGFDIIYSLQDKEFDESQNLYSIPVLMGNQKAILTSRILHTITFFILVTIGIIYSFQIYYWIGTMIFISLLISQHYLITPINLDKINIVFFTTNGIASMILAIFIIIDLVTQSL